MTVYARTDLMHVGISRDHGGCGSGHGRPVVDGAPAKVWALTCHSGCEDFLRSDPLWSSTPAGIPETHDETAVRQDIERRGQMEQQESTALALGQLAKMPEAMALLAQVLSGQQIGALAGPGMVRLCKNGHRNVGEAKFCTECGACMDEGVPSDRGPALPAAPPEQPLAPQAPSPDRADADAGPELPQGWEDMPLGDLKELAKRMGIKTTRSREDQVAAISAHLPDQ